MSSQYRSEKDGENIGIIVENKLVNGLEINLECVIIFNHGFSVFNVNCGPRLILMASTSRRALISISGCNKHLKPVIESYIVAISKIS